MNDYQCNRTATGQLSPSHAGVKLLLLAPRLILRRKEPGNEALLPCRFCSVFTTTISSSVKMTGLLMRLQGGGEIDYSVMINRKPICMNV